MCGLNNRFLFYIGGGRIGHSILYVNIEMLDLMSYTGWSILSINVRTKQWRPRECMNSVAIENDIIIIFGGWEENKRARSKCFIYNHTKNILTRVNSKLKRKDVFFYRLTPIFIITRYMRWVLMRIYIISLSRIVNGI